MSSSCSVATTSWSASVLRSLRAEETKPRRVGLTPPLPPSLSLPDPLVDGDVDPVDGSVWPSPLALPNCSEASESDKSPEPACRCCRRSSSSSLSLLEPARLWPPVRVRCVMADRIANARDVTSPRRDRPKPWIGWLSSPLSSSSSLPPMALTRAALDSRICRSRQLRDPGEFLDRIDRSRYKALLRARMGSGWSPTLARATSAASSVSPSKLVLRAEKPAAGSCWSCREYASWLDGCAVDCVRGESAALESKSLA